MSSTTDSSLPPVADPAAPALSPHSGVGVSPDEVVVGLGASGTGTASGGAGLGTGLEWDGDGEEDSVGANDDPMAPLMQCGTVRVNCVGECFPLQWCTCVHVPMIAVCCYMSADCLDRTNVAQYYIGAHVLGKQLHALGILESPELVSFVSCPLHVLRGCLLPQPAHLPTGPDLDLGLGCPTHRPQWVANSHVLPIRMICHGL